MRLDHLISDYQEVEKVEEEYLKIISFLHLNEVAEEDLLLSNHVLVAELAENRNEN